MIKCHLFSLARDTNEQNLVFEKLSQLYCRKRFYTSQNTGDAGEDFTDADERVLRDLRQDGDVGRVVRRVASTHNKYIDVYDYIHCYRQLHAKRKCSVDSIQQRRPASESTTDSQCSPVEFKPSVQSDVLHDFITKYHRFQGDSLRGSRKVK